MRMKTTEGRIPSNSPKPFAKAQMGMPKPCRMGRGAGAGSGPRGGRRSGGGPLLFVACGVLCCTGGWMVSGVSALEIGAPSLQSLQPFHDSSHALLKTLERTDAADGVLAGDSISLEQSEIHQQALAREASTPRGHLAGQGTRWDHFTKEASMMDQTRFAVQGTGFGLMLYAMYLLFVVSPNARAEWSIGVNRVFGKLIFLTTQAICILTAYFGLGFVAEGMHVTGRPTQKLSAAVHALAPVAGGLGYFLSIMFYALVWPDQSFQEGAVQYWEARGMPFGRWQHWIHATSLPLVLADAFTKRPSALNSALLPPASYVKGCFLFSCWYTVLIRFNFRLTGKWPYPFLSKFKQAWKHWLFYAFCFLNIVSFTFIHRAVLLTVARMQMAYAEIRNASPLIRRDDTLDAVAAQSPGMTEQRAEEVETQVQHQQQDA